MGIKKSPAKSTRTRARPTQGGGLADSLFTKVQQRVLGVLFGQPDRSFYANELIALAASGPGAVQCELARLAASGLVTVSPIGNQKHYQANAASPVFADLSPFAARLCAHPAARASVLWMAVTTAAARRAVRESP